jgi:CheY-like chemotaxis protein
VLQESLTNVHRYSGSPSAEIRIFQSPSKVHLEIVDHGKGVKGGTERSTFAGAPTLGVGIPGMRERIRQLGGQLEVEFSNEGARVYATLPRVASTEESGERSVGELFRDKGNFQANLRQRPDVRKRILIADDHEVMRRGVRGLVESQEEWSVCGEAIEGNEAVSKTKELRPDLLILDVSMPGMSGIEAAVHILKDDPNTKILFFTMHDSPQMMREISNVGAWGYVAKARAGNDLVDAVRIILDGKKFFPRLASAR